MAYATIAELNTKLGYTPANAQTLLDRGSRDVDQALLCSIYDPADADVIAALKEATLEQIAVGLDVGDKTGAGRTNGGFSIGRLSVQAQSFNSNDPAAPFKIGTLWSQAFYILQSAGLTGFGPGA